MNEQQQAIITNSALLHVVPQIISFQAMFSDLTGALETAFEGIASSLSGENVDLDFKEKVDDNISDLFTQITPEFMKVIPGHIASFPELVNEIENNGAMTKAESLISEIKTEFSNLPALDQPLDNDGVMAYVAVMNSDEKTNHKMQALISCFKDLFDAIEESTS